MLRNVKLFHTASRFVFADGRLQDGSALARRWAGRSVFVTYVAFFPFFVGVALVYFGFYLYRFAGFQYYCLQALQDLRSKTQVVVEVETPAKRNKTIRDALRLSENAFSGVNQDGIWF